MVRYYQSQFKLMRFNEGGDLLHANYNEISFSFVAIWLCRGGTFDSIAFNSLYKVGSLKELHALASELSSTIRSNSNNCIEDIILYCNVVK